VINFHNVSLIGGPGLLTYPVGTPTIYMAHEHWLICPTHVLWRYNREPCDSRDCLRCVLVYRRPPQLWRHTGALGRGLKNIDALVAFSKFSRDQHRAFGLDRDMEVLPAFLPDDDPGIPDLGDAEPPTHRPYFLVCGRVEPGKGLEDAIEAFGQFPEADLVIAGTGSDAARLRQRAVGQPNILWLGHRRPEELRHWYRRAVAVIVPSRGYETFGLVLIEAFREGVPVLARNRGSFPEIVQGGGILFDTVAELRTAAADLLDNPARRAKLAREAHDAFLHRYAEKRVLPAYLDIVRAAMDRRTRRAG
jgi:glycosyltransferase involved in cell wall biosynthesis